MTWSTRKLRRASVDNGTILSKYALTTVPAPSSPRDTVKCGCTPSYNNYNLHVVIRCTGGSFNEITLGISWSGAAPNFKRKVEQLWYCLENPLTNIDPTVIVASGSSDITLSCTSAPGITGFADDIISTCTDPVSSHSVEGSIINHTFYYRGMVFETNYPEHNPDSATLKWSSASLTGPVFKDFYLYENKAISGQGIDTTQIKVIKQVKAWECRDENNEQPLYFTGTGEFDWSVDPYSTCYNPVKGPNPSLYCYWNDNIATLQPGVPFDIPKIRASLVNMLPPDYGFFDKSQAKIAPKVQSSAQIPDEGFSFDTVAAEPMRVISGIRTLNN
ncbi:hypothetical protein BU23DRAFT_562671 [Bimuria novae-zelandiae CBS 107.79]|uniref:Uncharacterized protein n=1 Tax=Bimuria novae-zelandiae CBS 107.79 TaxID=1447943 RepID=A0A6A5VUN5_9PLEO|nr:hypothetical protein BU23DRAFT_562671 [Bimuria novae-zelandiae CBS 107.79]